MAIRRTFTIQERAEIVLRLQNGENNAAVCKELNVPHSTVATMWRDRAKILKCLHSKSVTIKRIRKPTHQDVENALLMWIQAQEHQVVHFSVGLIQEKANQFAQLSGKADFVCSTSWVYRFLKRNNIVLGTVFVEPADESEDDLSNFGADINPAEAERNMNGGASPKTETPKKPHLNNTSKNRSSVPVTFKLKLISEVKKHDIVWQDLRQRKNKDLINDAWQKIRKALVIKHVGYCEKQWKLLIHGYRSHINRGIPMNIDLVREMAFMTPQLKKSSSDGDQSDSEASETPAKSKPHTPKPKKVVKRANTSESDSTSEAERASVAILKLLFKNVAPDTMLPVKNSLVQVLINVMPEVDAKISEHAKQHMQRSGDYNNLDWSSLDIPAEICKAVWDYKVLQKLLKD